MSSPEELAGLAIQNDFWEVYRDLVALVWHTEPKERLGIVVPYLRREYGEEGRSGAYRRLENHVLRTVSFMEHFESNFSRDG